VIVLTGTSLSDQLAISAYCHKNGTYLVIADIFAKILKYVFVTAKGFAVADPTGENPLNGIVAGIDEEGLVSTFDET
jgi:ubiquitin-activating enzyme E1